MSGQQTATQTQATGPSPMITPYLQYGAKQAASLYQSNSPQYYPGQTVANQSPLTQAGNQAASALAMNGNQAENAGNGYLASVLSPNYVNTQNANQAALNKSISDAIIPQVNAQFSLGGRYGSPDQAGTMTTALANAIAPQMYGQYQANQQIQNSAAGMAPGYAQQQQSEIQGLQNAGAAQDQYNQSLVDANVNRWNYNQNLAGNKLAQYMGIVGNPVWGSNSTATSSQPGGGLTGFLGGVLGGIL